ncbi:Unknown protein [Striga hermonthica]|uniref:Uncharacterized protein n=1 Tax=Striga hermonthica TaxID=68872 RepID=A0A9N7RDA4_STRHE|nr:Unknown protein [Striga hermonthica]
MVGGEEGGGWPPAPGGAPQYVQREESRPTHFDNSVNAVSFGFVATAILISMFLVMAVFEKFLRATSPEDSQGRRRQRSPDRIGGDGVKLGCPSSPKVSINAREVSVVMPGDSVPTFLAHPAPVHCPLETVRWPSHQQTFDNIHCLPSSSQTR